MNERDRVRSVSVWRSTNTFKRLRCLQIEREKLAEAEAQAQTQRRRRDVAAYVRLVCVCVSETTQEIRIGKWMSSELGTLL